MRNPLITLMALGAWVLWIVLFATWAQAARRVEPPEYVSTISKQEVHEVLKKRLKSHSKKRWNARVLAKHVVKLGQKHQVDPAMILAIIQIESSFTTDAVSRVGAVGLMQVMPRTARYIARQTKYKRYRRSRDLKNPYINLSLGVAYVAYLRAKFDKNREWIAAYNLGPTRVRRMIASRTFVLRETRPYVNGIQREHARLSAGRLHLD